LVAGKLDDIRKDVARTNVSWVQVESVELPEMECRMHPIPGKTGKRMEFTTRDEDPECGILKKTATGWRSVSTAEFYDTNDTRKDCRAGFDCKMQPTPENGFSAPEPVPLEKDQRFTLVKPRARNMKKPKLRRSLDERRR